MHPDLAACLTLITDATAGLDDEQAAARGDGRWSIAEIVEHLDRTYTGTTKGLHRCLDAGAARASARTLRSRALTFWVVTLGRFPTGIEAPTHVVPKGRVRLSEMLARSRADLEAMDAAIDAAEARFGPGPVLDHPILGPFAPAQWRRFHHVHTRHHQRQILERRARVA
ncbi:MAG: DUF1569 domain-containing protein [Acidobacteria bacterium]|nr:DUF1569 domain-containing protein [Acidobacteriota bacterium]